MQIFVIVIGIILILGVSISIFHQCNFRLTTGGPQPKKRQIRSLLIALGSGFSLFLFLWGIIQIQNSNENSKDGVPLIFLVDISYSMLTSDIYPQRLFQVQQALREYLNSAPNVPIGLIAIAGKPFLLVPPTNQYQILQKKISELSPFMIPQDSYPELSGSALGEALLLAKKTSGDTGKPRLIILSDGDSNIGVDPKRVAQSLRDSFSQVTFLLIGTTNPTPLEFQNPRGNTVRPIDPKTKKQIIIQNNPDLFRELAQIFGGDFYQITDRDTLLSKLNDFGDDELISVNTSRDLPGILVFSLITLLGSCCLILYFQESPGIHRKS